MNNILNRYKFFVLFYNIIILIILKRPSDNVNSILLKKLQRQFNITNKLINIYSILYDFARFGHFKPKYINVKNKIFNTKYKKGICICSIGKNENLYIKEFLDYYLLLGVKKIIIFDNNDINGENFKEIIQKYYTSEEVDIIDVRGITSIQIPIYNYCYQNNYDLYDWIGLIDIDEYIYIQNKQNINSYFYNKRFRKCELVFLNWVIYNDNNLIKYENRSLNERFKIPKKHFIQGKSFVRGGIKNLLIPTSHIPGININYFCNSKGYRIYPKNFFNYKIEFKPLAYIKHFYTKTVEEFCKKIIRGHAHYHKDHPNYIQTIKSKINMFFTLNEISKIKIKILENCTGMNLTYFKINKL